MASNIWTDYINANPGLAGMSEEQAQDHFALYGFYEARLLSFDASEYLAANPDLVEAGISEESALTHFSEYGQAEGRIWRWDADSYYELNPDLEANGVTLDNALSHYALYGRYEHRIVTFDPAEYLAANPDLAEAGVTGDRALLHYLTYGRAEGRALSFDPEAYLQLNPDLVEAGITEDTALEHYMLYGRAEDRAYVDLVVGQGGSVSTGDVIDGLIAGATVFRDANGNGVLDDGEFFTTTDSEGNFYLRGGEGNLRSVGGTDISTNLPTTGVYTAPCDARVLSPLTTLVSTIACSGKTVDEAQAMVKSALGLDQSLDLGTFNYLAASTSSDETTSGNGVAAMAAGVKVQNIISATASVLTGASGEGVDEITGSQAAVESLASAILEGNGASLDLDDQDVLSEVIGTAAQKVEESHGVEGLAQNSQAAGQAAAKVVSESNETISLVQESVSNPVDSLTQIVQVATVTQGQASDALEEAAGSGDASDIESVTENYTGQNLNDQFDNADIGEVTGDDDVDQGTENGDVPIPTPEPTPDPGDSGGDHGGGSGGNPTPPPPPPSFSVTEGADGVWTVSTRNGNVVVTESGDNNENYVFTPTTGSAVTVAKADVDSLVLNTITLTGDAAVLTGETITGSGTVNVTKVEEQVNADDNSLNADLGDISTTNVTASIDLSVGMDFSGDLGKAAVTISSAEGQGQPYFNALGIATLGTASFNIESGALAHYSDASAVSGLTITGTGSVEIGGVDADTDLSHLADGLSVTASVDRSQSAVDLSGNTKLGSVDTFQLSGDVTMTAAQVSGKNITDNNSANLTVTGSDDGQTINVGTMGTNSITGGQGADTINLSAWSGTDTIHVAGGTTSDSVYSEAGDTWDVITNFDVAHDKLDLPSAALLGDAGSADQDGVAFSVSNGIATVTSESDFGDIVTALATSMGTGKSTVGFVHGNSTYILQGDGTSGNAASDIFIELQGTELTTLAGLIVDVTAPAKPTITGISDDTGASDSDGITSDVTLYFTGTAEAGSRVTLYKGGSTTNVTAIAEDDGSFSIDYTGTTLHVHAPIAFTVTATDAANNESEASDVFNVTIDSDAPDKAAENSLVVTDSDTSDTYSAGDVITLKFSEAVDASKVTIGNLNVSNSHYLGQNSILSAVDDDNDGYADTFNLTLGGDNVVLATGDIITIDAANVKDKAGNSATGPLTFTLPNPDVTPPEAPVVAQPPLTNDSTPEITVTAESGSTVNLYKWVDAGDTDGVVQEGELTSLGSETATGGTATITAGESLSNGDHLVATATDAAGNVSDYSATDVTLALDTIAPDKAAENSITFTDADTSDTYSAGDVITLAFSEAVDASKVTFANLVLDSHSFGDDATLASVNAVNGYADTFTITLGGENISVAAEDTITITTANVVDKAGNQADGQLSFSLDFFAPDAPTNVTLAPSGGTEVANTVNSTNTALTFSASIEAGQATDGKAEFYVGDTKVGTDAVIGSTDTTVTFTTSDGTPTNTELQAAIAAGGVVSVRLYDAAGNEVVSTDNNPTLTVDYEAPGAPHLICSNVPESLFLNAGWFNDTNSALNFNGFTTEEGATVKLFMDGSDMSVADQAQEYGSFSLYFNASSLADGDYSFTVTATDAAGNTSVASNAFVVTVDTTAPTAHGTTAIEVTDDNSNGTYDAGDVITLKFSEAVDASNVTLDNLGLDNSHSFGGGATLEGVNAVSGYADTFNITLGGDGISVAAEDIITITTTNVVDQAGNTADGDVVFTMPTLDSTPPTATVTTASINGSGNASVQSTETGTAYLVDSTANVSSVSDITALSDNQYNSVTIDQADTATDLSAADLAEGTYKVYAVDAAGNLSEASTGTVTVDTTAPEKPAITGITDDTGASSSDGITNDTTLTITGTAEAGAIVTLYNGGSNTNVSATADAQGVFSIDYSSVELDQGDYTFTVAATDAAGNESEASEAFNVTVDATAPTVTGISYDTALYIDLSEGSPGTSVSGVYNGFSISYDGSGTSITNTYIIETRLTLFTSSSPTGMVKVSYDSVSEGIADAAGNKLASGDYYLCDSGGGTINAAGSSTFFTGAGDDNITCGAGVDTIVNKDIDNNGDDTFSNFTSGQDKIQLSAADLNALTGEETFTDGGIVRDNISDTTKEGYFSIMSGGDYMQASGVKGTFFYYNNALYFDPSGNSSYFVNNGTSSIVEITNWGPEDDVKIATINMAEGSGSFSASDIEIVA